MGDDKSGIEQPHALRDDGIIMSNRSLLLLVLSFLLFAGNGWGAAYYVDATGGNDSNAGTTINSAWKTIEKVNASSFSPGDQILLKKGEVWRETLVVSSSGSSGNVITYSSYGIGPPPLITGFNVASGWDGPNANGVYTFKYLGIDVQFLLRDGNLLDRDTIINPAPDKFFFQYGVLYYKPPTGHTPSEYALEYSLRYRGIYINNKNYVTIDGINFMGGNGINMGTDGALVDIVDSSNITFTNFDVKYAWYTAVYSHTLNKPIYNLTISNGVISFGGNGIGLYSKYFGINNTTISNLTVKNIGVFLNDNRAFGDLDREGIGINGYGISNGFTISDVIIHDVGNATDTNNYGLFLYQANNVTITRFNIYNCSRAGIAIMDGTGPYGKNITLKYGIIRDNGYTNINSNEYSGGILVVNSNVGGLDNLYLFNIDIYRNSGNATTNNSKRGGLLIHKSFDVSNDAPITIKNCIISHNNTYDLRINQGIGSLSGLKLDYNNYYRESGDSIYWNNDTYDYKHIICAGPGCYSFEKSQDSNSKFGDPKYVTNGSDFHLQESSPSINAGTNVGLTQDYEGNTVPYGAAPDIGAYEHQAIPHKLLIPSSPFNLRIGN